MVKRSSNLWSFLSAGETDSLTASTRRTNAKVDDFDPISRTGTKSWAIFRGFFFSFFQVLFRFCYDIRESPSNVTCVIDGWNVKVQRCRAFPPPPDEASQHFLTISLKVFFFLTSRASCRWTCLRKRTVAVSGLAVAGPAGQLDVSLIDTDKQKTRRANRPRNPKVSLLTAV